MPSLAPTGPPLAPGDGGVTVERTFEGLEARLHSTGIKRFVGAAFLGLWLVFWAVGECLVLGILVLGAWSLVTGNPPGPEREPLALVPSLGVGAFLLLWVAFWTVGGIAAFYEFLRLLWSVDRLCATAGALHITRRAGFITRRQRLPRERIRRIYRLDTASALLADTLDGSVELTRFGTPAQRERILVALSNELKLSPVASLPPVLPSDWREIAAPEGGRLLVKNPAMRRLQARIAWVVVVPLCAAAIFLAAAAFREPNLIAFAFVVSGAAALALWGAVVYQWARTEWLIEPGRIIAQRRFGSRVRERLAGTSIVLSESRDSDGDAWYAVEIAARLPEPARPSEQRRARRTILSRPHDPTEPRRLAEWLAGSTELSLIDRIQTPTEKEADVAGLVRQLRTTGRFGRWVAHLLERKRNRG